MKPIITLGVALVLLGASIGLVAPSADASTDPGTSYAQPANALVMPFDAKQQDTLLVVSNPAGVSPFPGDATIAAVTTHWAFWNDRGRFLAEVSICLTLNDTVVVDPRNLHNVDPGNNLIGPQIDLSGDRGFVTVTAYATDEICNDGTVRGRHLIDSAITGSFLIKHKTTGAAMGAAALGFGLVTDGNGTHTNLPNFLLAPQNGVGAPSLDLQTLAPATLDSSMVVLLALKEQAGNGGWVDELGPLLGATRASTAFYDDLEIPYSLPDIKFKTTLFTSLRPASSGSLIPDTVSLPSPGLFRISSLHNGAAPSPIGVTTFVYAFVAESVGGFAQTTFGQYGL